MLEPLPTPDDRASADLLGQLTAIIREVGLGLDHSAGRVLQLGLDRLGLAIGILARIEGDRYTVRHVIQPDGMGIEPGQVFGIGETYCREVIVSSQPVRVHHVSESKMRDHPAFKAFGLEAYLGVPVTVRGETWGTLNFSSSAPRDRPFGDDDVRAIELLAAWLGAEIERQELIAINELHRKESEDANRLTHMVLDRLPAMVWLKDTKNNMRLVNAAAATAAGSTPAQMADQPAVKFYPENAARFYRDDQEVMRSGKPKLGYVETIDGGPEQVVYVQTDKLPIFDEAGKVDGILVVATDISHLKRAEAELQESEERFRQAFENAPIGLALVSPEGKWLRVNAALARLLGYTAQELLATDFQTLTHPEDLSADLEQVGHVLAGTLKSYQMDKRYFHKTGRIVWVRLSVSLVRSPRSGQPLYFISQIEDITQKRRAEAQLEQRNDDLETLLYVISHDLREPLRAVRNFSAIVCKEYGKTLGERGGDMLGRVIRGGERLDQLLADVLTLSRAQRAELNVRRVPAGPVVKEVLAELHAAIEESGAEVVVADDLPALRVDRRWLKRAVYNLVSNALKFHQPGQVPQVKVLAYVEPAQPGRRRGLAGLVVADRGTGIPDAVRPHMFELFRRGVGRDVPGTGAGLAIVAQIAERYGGSARVEDREGGGSAFILTFKND